MRSIRAWAFAASVTLAACGGGSGGMSATSSTATDAGTDAGTGNPGMGGVGTTSAPDAGTSMDAGTSTATFLISITGLATSPENLVVPPGATVTVQTDGTEHSVTSQSAAGAYTPGSVAGVSFDTGIFAGTRTFTVPASAPVGTVVPYYCRVHFGMMTDATRLQLTIGATASAPAVPSTPAPAAPPSNMPSMPSGN